MTDVERFRAVYEATGVYERRLLPHYYHGVEDLDLVTELLNGHYGQPTADLTVVELGCGTGRLTARLAPYARRLIVADSSQAMIDAVQSRFPQATARVKDYAFDVDRMVSFAGNTGVYLQYAHTRIRSILRKAGDSEVTIDPTILLEPAERALALEIDAYSATLAEVNNTLEPHRLCGYLYDLARDFTTFYETCPVLGADEPIRSNRLALCQLTAHTLKHGLGLLGITAPERM